VPKPLSGSILTRRLADDTLVVDVKIRTERRMLGPASEWSEARARKLLENRLLPAAQLRQDWTALIPGAVNGGSNGEAAGTLTVREAATDYVEALSRYENPNTVSTYRSPVVKHLLPFLAYTDAERTVDRALAEVDEALMLRFVSTKQAERAVLRDIAEALAELESDVRGDPELLKPQLDAEEWRLLCRYGQRGGHHTVLDPSASGLVSLSSRGLSNNEINRCLAANPGRRPASPRVHVRIRGREVVAELRVRAVADRGGAEARSARFDPLNRHLVTGGELLGSRVLGALRDPRHVIAVLVFPVGKLAHPSRESVRQPVGQAIRELVGKLIHKGIGQLIVARPSDQGARARRAAPRGQLGHGRRYDRAAPLHAHVVEVQGEARRILS
jgi:hypothetical protein